MFLHKLEYYQGIMFLTTNRVKDFDKAIISRIHLILKYSPLNKDTKKGIWESFLAKSNAIYSAKQLEKLASESFNRRQVSFYIWTLVSISTNVLIISLDQKRGRGGECFGV